MSEVHIIHIQKNIHFFILRKPCLLYLNLENLTLSKRVIQDKIKALFDVQFII